MLFKGILKKNIIFGVLFFMHLTSLHSKAFFRMNEQCLKAQSLIYELRISEAKAILSEEKIKSPENIAVSWLGEYCLYITLFISENEKEYKASQQEWKNYIKSVENSPTDDAWYRFILSDMYLHRASVKLKMNDNFSAGSDIKTANLLLKDNEILFPTFLPDNKNIGLIKALFSAIPKNYAWLGNILGFEGNLEDGMLKIETYLNSPLNENEHKWLKVETAFIYALLQHHFQKKTNEAWQTIDKYTTDFKNNPLLNYMRATIAGYAGKNEEQIQILSQKPNHNNTLPFYYLDYMLGVAKLRALHTDAAMYFKLFTVKFKGENYIKSAYRYLAWFNIIRGDLDASATYYSLCLKNGKEYQEEDKQAAKEAKEALRWTKELLEARLLFDGHYYALSLDILNTIEEIKLTHIKFKLELNYRKARIFQETKEYASALVLFDKVINTGKNETYYYSAYSALQMGTIYELLKNKQQAKYYFEKAKNNFPKNEEYQNSIELKAKSGLKRIGH